MTANEKNDHYGKLNIRTETRFTEWYGMGFKYSRIEDMNFAVFTRIRAGRTVTVPAAAIMYADEIVYADMVASNL